MTAPPDDDLSFPGDAGTCGIALRYAFSVSLFFRERIIIDSPSQRAFVPPIGGEVWGPRLAGIVVPYSGADFGAVTGLDASYAIEATDGARIYVMQRGFMKRLDGGSFWSPSPPRAIGEPPQQSFADAANRPVPMRVRPAPLFDAPCGPHEWLSRTIIVGHAQRYSAPDHTLFTYYEVL
ncbi:MAG: DUF3237 family protein [Sphingomonas fennica]